jgi:hypothetical protein
LFTEYLKLIKVEDLNRTNDVFAAATDNMWCIYIDEEKFKLIKVEDINILISSVSNILKNVWGCCFTLYFWFDAMAGQLRFSSLCGVVDNLPFRSKIEITENMQFFSEKIYEYVKDTHVTQEYPSLGRPLIVYRSYN